MAADAVALVPNQGWDERILVCRCGPLVDVFVVVTRRFVVLVDTLVNAATGAALLAIAQEYLADRQLLVVNTHAHWDHAWGNQVFDGPGALHPAPIIGTRRCAALLASREAADKLAQMQAQEPERFAWVRLTPPSLLFDEQLRIDGGDLTLELFRVPGHAPDQAAIFIPEIRTLLAADAAEAPFPFAEAAETLPEIRASLARMVALEPAAALYCHAPETIGPALLRANLAYFDALEQRCRAALERGAPASPPDDADVEALAAFPFEEAIPPDVTVTQPEFYRPGHQKHIRLMLAHLASR